MLLCNCLLLLCFSSLIVNSNASSEQIQTAIDHYIKTHESPENIKNVIKEFLKVKNKSLQDKSVCEACQMVMRAGISLRKSGTSKEDLMQFAKKMCLWFSDFGETECFGFMDIEKDYIVYILDNTPDLTAERICAIQFQSSNCADPGYVPWSIDIPSADSLSYPQKNTTDHHDEEPIKILHLTDFHYDPLYDPGSKTICDTYLCCANTSGKADKPEEGAGYWGDYHVCDTPWHSILDLFAQIKKQHPKIDWVYFTGDIINHRSWATNKKDNSDAIVKVMEQLKESFGSVPVYSVLGNHESHPSDLYSPEEVIGDENLSSQWLLQLVAEEWSRWLPNSTKTDILQGGFYSHLIRPGLRVIGLNNNVCYVGNIWLIHKDKDPHRQLQWLVNTLLEAEKNGESVHILAHVPPGDSGCLKQWSHEFRRIVERFSHIISGQFNGHTHEDELKVFYSLNNPDEVINVAFNGGSLTSFIGLNPNYRIYDVNPDDYHVVDYDQWYYDLVKANKYPDLPPRWSKLYSFKEAYGLDQMEPGDFHNLLQRMAGDYMLVEQYRRFQVRDSPARMQEKCSESCLTNIFCSITNVEYENSVQCKAVGNILVKGVQKLVGSLKVLPTNTTISS